MKTLRLTPSDSTGTSPLKPTWQGIVNIDQFKWLGREDVHNALSMAHAEIGARHVRAAGMFGFDSRVYDVDPSSFLEAGPKMPRFNFQIINYYFDSCVERGVRPMITTCFTPERMATGPELTFDDSCNITPPADLQLWEDMVVEMLTQMIRRYGKSFMRECYFEVWNEPNLEGTFWVGGKDRWFALWKRTHAAIKSVDPEFRVGGPSSARGEWIRDLVEFGRKEGCVPDYLISHCYNNDSKDTPLSPFEGPATEKTNKLPGFLSDVVRAVRQLADDLNFKGELHWNEWGSSWHPFDLDRESENEAAFIVKTMAEVSQEADAFAYWNLSDIYNQVGYGRDTFHGNYGMLNLQNIRKPSYLAHQLLCKLGPKRIPLTVENGSECLNALHARAKDSSQLVVYNYQAKDRPAPEPVSVEVLLPDNTPVLEPVLYKLTNICNNAVTRWREKGAERYLSPYEAKQMRKESGLQPCSPESVKVEQKNGNTLLTFRLEGRGVGFLEWK